MSRAFVRESDADPGPLPDKAHQPASELRHMASTCGHGAHGLISWTAPLAQALLGREAGESVPFQGAEAEIVSIEP